MKSTCYDFGGTARPAPPGSTGCQRRAGRSTRTRSRRRTGTSAATSAIWGGAVAGATVCHDWTADAACAGFPLPAAHPTVNGGATRDYGYSYDGTSGCLFALGDAGVLFSLDPATAVTPCLHSGASVKLTPSEFYCDGGTGHVQGYKDARLEHIGLPTSTSTPRRSTITDADGSPVATRSSPRTARRPVRASPSPTIRPSTCRPIWC